MIYPEWEEKNRDNRAVAVLRLCGKPMRECAIIAIFPQILTTSRHTKQAYY